MSETKNSIISTETLTDIAQKGGFLLMAAAVGLSTLDLGGGRPDTKAILPNQPALATANDNGDNNPIRREREETAPHFISYSEIQRTASRSGK